jgi:hypothetical protein
VQTLRTRVESEAAGACGPATQPTDGALPARGYQ